MAQSSDVAKVILFLASEAADYMTGQAVNVGWKDDFLVKYLDEFEDYAQLPFS